MTWTGAAVLAAAVAAFPAVRTIATVADAVTR
jgi:hypothetical protein